MGAGEMGTGGMEPSAMVRDPTDVRIGVSLRSAYPVGDVREGARWMVERAAAARDAGLDSLFVGDHHVVPVPYYQNVPVLGRLLAEWGDAPAGALFLLPLWPPVLLAEQVGTLASLARGRFVLQCALGGGDQQFAGMGVDIRRRPSLFESGLDVVRRLLAGEEVGGARIAPVPPEPVEVWIGAAAPVAIERAARLGDAWLAGPEVTPDMAREQLETYREACHRHGRTPTCMPVRKDVYVGESEADVEAVAGPVVAAGYRGFDPDALVVGTVEQVAGQFRRYAALGFTDVVARQLADDQRAALASIARLADVKALVADA